MIEEIKKVIHHDLILVDQVIREDLASNVVLINQIGNYIISGGGKRIRPLLTILCGNVIGYKNDGNNLLHKMAAMVEYIHTATLLHDDVVDESGMRRGRQTSNAVFGNAPSVLVGDFIYTRAFQMMVESNSIRLLKVMADSTNKISEGEVLQLLNIGRDDVSETEYFKVIEAKTATLFKASALVASIISNATQKQEQALVEYAVTVGNAFQIVDDILDYVGSSENIGKNIGDDLLEGKITLPLIHALKVSDSDSQLIIRNSIKNPNQAKIQSILHIIQSCKSVDYCLNIAKSYVNQALELLTIFEDNCYKECMQKLAYAAINRVS